MQKLIFFTLLFVAFTFPACSNGDNEAKPPAAAVQDKPLFNQAPATPFQSISVTQAKELMAKRPGLVILDVRTPEELKEGAIEGSTLVPFWAIMQNKLTLPKETPVMLVCAVGGRSFAAGQMMVKYGYKEVYNVSGGLTAWKEAGLPVKY
ncbi:MAG: rhodanese-like domain-containing protein [Deltaproteobacteria bacterium]|nr:rhodanese-like domain-containing protein [Deltaproteobacteria bacterium]